MGLGVALVVPPDELMKSKRSVFKSVYSLRGVAYWAVFFTAWPFDLLDRLVEWTLGLRLRECCLACLLLLDDRLKIMLRFFGYWCWPPPRNGEAEDSALICDRQLELKLCFPFLCAWPLFCWFPVWLIMASERRLLSSLKLLHLLSWSSFRGAVAMELLLILTPTPLGALDCDELFLLRRVGAFYVLVKLAYRFKFPVNLASCSGGFVIYIALMGLKLSFFESSAGFLFALVVMFIMASYLPLWDV